jgi:hypothetical protein
MWRRTRKRVKAIAGLVGRTAVFALLTLMNISACVGLTEETRNLRLTAGVPGPLALLGFSGRSTSVSNSVSNRLARADWLDTGQNLYMLCLWAFSGLLASVFLVVLLRHRRWWVTIPAWGTWLFVVNCFISLAVPALGSWLTPEERQWDGLFGKGVFDLVDHLSWIAALTVVAMFSVPLAMIAKRTVRGLVHRQRWRTRRRIRRWRQAA